MDWIRGTLHTLISRNKADGQLDARVFRDYDKAVAFRDAWERDRPGVYEFKIVSELPRT